MADKAVARCAEIAVVDPGRRPASRLARPSATRVIEAVIDEFRAVIDEFSTARLL